MLLSKIHASTDNKTKKVYSLSEEKKILQKPADCRIFNLLAAVVQVRDV